MIEPTNQPIFKSIQTQDVGFLPQDPHQRKIATDIIWSITYRSTPEEFDSECKKQNGYDINHLDFTVGGYRYTGRATALHLAAAKANVNVIKHLVEQYKADINIGNLNHYTPLINAVQVQEYEPKRRLLAAVQLIRLGAKVNFGADMFDYKNVTPLRIVTYKAEDRLLASYLILNGAIAHPPLDPIDGESVERIKNLHLAHRALEVSLNFFSGLNDQHSIISNLPKEIAQNIIFLTFET